MTLPVDWAEHVRHFWFVEHTHKDWWTASAPFDAEIRHRFGALHATLESAPTEPLLETSNTALAAIIVLDQFSRNMYRHSARAFANDTKARSLAEQAIACGHDQSLTSHERQFLYMPFMHAEDPVAQTKAVVLFATLGDPDGLRSAHEHKAIIDRFGRFPHRNAALNRADTADEASYLRGDVKRFGQ